MRNNYTRGDLVEFLVAKAVGADERLRVTWDNFDLTTRSGIRVEVKASGYLQSWPQKRLSQISFSGLTGRTWDAKKGWGPKREVRADVFVFAVQTCKDHASYDALDVEQWDFYVVPASAVVTRGSRSVDLRFVCDHGEAVGYGELASAIEAAHVRDHGPGDAAPKARGGCVGPVGHGRRTPP